jgi:hypothetical protein
MAKTSDEILSRDELFLIFAQQAIAAQDEADKCWERVNQLRAKYGQWLNPEEYEAVRLRAEANRLRAEYEALVKRMEGK